MHSLHHDSSEAYIAFLRSSGFGRYSQHVVVPSSKVVYNGGGFDI